MENGRNKVVINIHVEWENGVGLPAINGAKCALTLHTCISVMDRVKINEQNKRIGTYKPKLMRFNYSCRTL